MKLNDKNKSFGLNKHIEKIKDNTTFIAKSTMDLVDETTSIIVKIIFIKKIMMNL